MPIVADDVGAWAYARLNVAAVTSVCSGGVWNSRPGETAAAPYLVFTVNRGSVEYTSGGEIPRFTINAAVFVDQTTTTQAQGVEIAVGQAIPVSPTGVTAMVRNGAATVIFAEPREASADVAYPMRAKSDVVACKLSWELMIQAATTGV